MHMTAEQEKFGENTIRRISLFSYWIKIRSEEIKADMHKVYEQICAEKQHEKQTLQ